MQAIVFCSSVVEVSILLRGDMLSLDNNLFPLFRHHYIVSNIGDLKKNITERA